MALLLELFVLSVSVVLIAEANWTHQEQARWYDDFSECSLAEQSPIEIKSSQAVTSFLIPSLHFTSYNSICQSPAQITNNGHTADIVLSDACVRPQVKGGPAAYNAVYEAQSIHFHWGSSDIHGSEHIIDSQRYSLEAHIVHKNTKYATVDEASGHRDGLLVLGIFYKAKATTTTPFSGLELIIDSLSGITNFNTSSNITGLRLDSLLGNINTGKFYTYDGSLTTPPCSQAVTWVVFPQAIDITLTQMQQFRLLADAEGKPLVNNYRFIQPKGSRKVYYRSSILSFGNRSNKEAEFEFSNDI